MSGSPTKHYFEAVPVLTSDRLILRSIEPSDAVSIIELSVYDGVFASNETEVLVILDKVKLDQKKGNGIQWGIELKAKAGIIGSCSYHRGYQNNIGEIGYVLKPRYRGQGIMTEAVKLITDFGLHTMRLRNVIAYTESSNRVSTNVLLRAGFHQVAPEHDYIKFAIRKQA